MKRTIPLLIAAIGGFVLIFTSFIPQTENWGEIAVIWFDILAAIAFLLGGGNLLMTHLKKISDRAAGWGYSIITIISFGIMLAFGLFKVGVTPSLVHEHYGETFAPLKLAEIPTALHFSVDGSLPEAAVKMHRHLPLSVQNQFFAKDGKLTFKGWMTAKQKNDLLDYSSRLDWRASIHLLAEKAKPKDGLAGSVSYKPLHRALSVEGVLSDENEKALLAIDNSPAWTSAISLLSKQSHQKINVELKHKPEPFVLPSSLEGKMTLTGNSVELTGPLSGDEKTALIAQQFPIARPLSEEARDLFLKEIESKGSPATKLTDKQKNVFNGLFSTPWTVEQLKAILNNAGKASASAQTPVELLKQQQEGDDKTKLERFHPKGKDVALNEKQEKLLQHYIKTPEMRIDQLTSQLKKEGDFTGAQKTKLISFLKSKPTIGNRNKALYTALTIVGELNNEQADFLLADYKKEQLWTIEAGQLFRKAHVTKYPWAGKYSEPTSGFGWMYEYVFKPLQATVFALLAFFVASAAFRAFRAKNVEAFLLLGTAFLVLLGRTFAGVYLTSWLPESLAFLRIENITVWIMGTINKAGNRAIMIGIALGIASTSLKILLGIDRSYLGSGD